MGEECCGANCHHSLSPNLTHLDDAVQAETIVFWDLVPLLQPQTQSFTPTPLFPEHGNSPGATFPSLWTAARLLFVIS